MLWLGLHFPYLPLQSREPVDVQATVIAERNGRRRTLIACNKSACAAGLAVGMDATTALLCLPTVKILARARRSERAALLALCGWAEQFSSVICMDAERWMLWMEVGGSIRYFHGLSALRQQVQSILDALGYTANMAIAPTLEAAALLARHGHSLSFTERRDCHAFLDGLPLSHLALSPSVTDVLHGLGWRTIGELRALPADQLARRFGNELLSYLRRLYAEEADPRPRVRQPVVWKRRLDFDCAIQANDALLFPLRRMLLELQGYLRGRDTALQSLTLHLLHEKSPATVLVLNTTAPQRDAQHLLLLLRERLERTNWPEAVRALMLEVTQFVPLGDTQLTLFADAQKNEQSWATLIDKLIARLGPQAVRRLGLVNDHRPEKAWCTLPADHQANDAPDTLPDAYPERPLWLLTPRLITHMPTFLGKPERIESGWWETDQRRDYYLARTAEGSRWWVYRDADTAQWYLHGLWA